MRADYKQDIISTLIYQIFKIVSGPFVLVLIPIYLSPIEQGYWFTFASIAALAVFADLGFSNIILQFAAHEFAFLSFNSFSIIEGDKEHLYKLASFFRFSIKWLFKIVAIIFPFIIVGGYLFLNSKNNFLNWEIPWVIYSICSAVVFINTIILSFFEGCNSVRTIQLIKLRISFNSTICAVACLYFGMELYALSTSLIVSSLTGIYFIYKYFRRTIIQLWNISKISSYNWKEQFLSLIWRYAISWCSGYFIFQIFVPIAFYFHGPEFAGKIGISVSMWSAGAGIASSWITAINPRLNMFVSKKQWNELDILFNDGMIKSMGTIIIGGISFLVIFYLFNKKIPFFERILSFEGMIILFVCWIGQLYTSNWAIYLRSHKKEPMVWISAFSAMYVSITTILCGYYLKDTYIFLGFLSSYVYILPATIYIVTKEKKLHCKYYKENNLL